MSYCAKNGTVSSTESPIALGRPTRWKITELGSNAKELPRNGQRISVNKYYPGLRDTFFMENDGFNCKLQIILLDLLQIIILSSNILLERNASMVRVEDESERMGG